MTDQQKMNCYLAETVLGWKRRRREGQPGFTWIDKDSGMFMEFKGWNPCHNVNELFGKVIPKLRGDGFKILLWTRDDEPDHAWIAAVSMGDRQGTGKGLTAGVAIALAVADYRKDRLLEPKGDDK